ncbi:MAG: hypothetical protein ACPGU1_09700 [Myxococcota bacterium]
MPARSELVQHLYIYQAAESVEARGAALAEAWRHAGALRDDAILRRLLQELPDVPGALTAAHLFEVAVREASAPEGSAAALSTLDKIDTSTDEATRWTAARGELLRASLLPPSQEQQALVALRRVGRLNPVGALGRAQMAQAWLLEGSIEHRSGRYKEAIAAYLKVPQSSGLWRDARLGMAWSQLRIAQSDRALASLALLPGGLTGEPERALVAAMAAGTLGKVDAARAVVDEARLRAKAWLKDDVEPAALLSAALPIGRSVRLRETAEGLFVRLSAHPAVRLYAAELRDARSLQETTPGDPAIAAYVAQLESGWPALVERLVSRERARVGHGLAGLDALEPQLRAGD